VLNDGTERDGFPEGRTIGAGIASLAVLFYFWAPYSTHSHLSSFFEDKFPTEIFTVKPVHTLPIMGVPNSFNAAKDLPSLEGKVIFVTGGLYIWPIVAIPLSNM
jgi:hypothetical protein